MEQGIAKDQQAMVSELVDFKSEEDRNGPITITSTSANGNHKFEDPKTPVWLCIGTNGEAKGPYSLAFLKHWKEIIPNSSEYKVLKIGQSEENAIPLNDAINLA